MLKSHSARMKLNLTALARLPTDELSAAVKEEIVRQLLQHPDEDVRQMVEERRDEFLLKGMRCLFEDTRTPPNPKSCSLQEGH